MADFYGNFDLTELLVDILPNSREIDTEFSLLKNKSFFFSFSYSHTVKKLLFMGQFFEIEILLKLHVLRALVSKIEAS